MNLCLPHVELMDRVYGWQRHIYDPTRKYYLLGRDRLLHSLKCAPGEHVLEVGCGTGRNLLKLTSMHPDTDFYGIDASNNMLEVAAQKVQRQGVGNRIRLSQGLAEELDPFLYFGRQGTFDVIFFSYALSMIPDWQGALRRAVINLRRGGRLGIVDFWDQASHPWVMRKLLLTWLAGFHVKPRAEIKDFCQELAQERGAQVDFESLYGGYACLIMLDL